MNHAIDRTFALRLFVLLLACEIALVAAGLLTAPLEAPYDEVGALFDLDGEATLPAWFSSMQLLGIGLAFAHLGLLGRPADLPSKRFYLFAAAVGIFLSMDECIGVHERVNAVIQQVQGGILMGGSEDWMLPYFAVAFVTAFLFRGSLRALWRRHRPVVYVGLAGAALFLLGAVGMEYASFVLIGQSPDAPSYIYLVAAEEFGEMMGASFILLSVLLLQHRLRAVGRSAVSSLA